uniref:Uncharacterized protein n=1 Tax=Meloidogyne enterolobii TaxID=390850 RepID=A0A6V7WAF8_MELEN|nr:unnamed protein product [Meloidogyne enterolobii]
MNMVAFLINSVTLQAGANLDLNVVVLVQKSFVREGCHDLLLLDDCIKRKCTQNVLYKVDLGYSKVRRSAEGTLTNYSQSMIRRNNEMLEKIAIKNSQMQNDAFQPFLYSEFKRLIELFYNGNKRIFALFNISMEKLIDEKLEIVEKNNYCDNKLPPEFEKIKKELLQIIENNWKKSIVSSSNDSRLSVNFFDAIKRRIIPSPIQMIDAMNNPIQKSMIIKYTNQLYLLLLRLSVLDGRGEKQKLDGKCLSLLEEVNRIIENEPIVTRLNYSPSRSLFIRDLESLLKTRASRGQRGSYYENNMSTFRFMSMTAIIMEESREYNSFNLMVDLGSTLGLYFGLTILTIFEFIIFILYRSASHNPAEVQKPPPESVIYNIPIRSNVNKKDLRQRKKKKNYIIPIIS